MAPAAEEAGPTIARRTVYLHYRPYELLKVAEVRSSSRDDWFGMIPRSKVSHAHRTEGNRATHTLLGASLISASDTLSLYSIIVPSPCYGPQHFQKELEYFT